jgi:hypothetical protein
MPFNSDNANLKHYPGTTKEDAERGYERLDKPPQDGSNNDRQLEGGKLPIRKDTIADR